MKFVNLNKHEVSYKNAAGEIITLPPCPNPCLMASSQVVVGEIDSMPVRITKWEEIWEEITNLPEPQEGVILVVNMLIRDHLVGRTDVVAMDSGVTAVRFPKGHPQAGQIHYVTGWSV